MRLAGPLALAAAAATILLAGLAIAVLATAELRVRDAVDQQHALDAAVQEASAAAGAAHLGDDRGALRAKSSLATSTADLSERLEQLVALGSAAALPIEGASRAVLSATKAKELLAESIADARQADEDALVAADQALLPAMDQARHELFALADEWSALARTRRVEATTQAADSARRIKAWIEILSLLAVGLVVAVGAIAVRRERAHVRG